MVRIVNVWFREASGIRLGKGLIKEKRDNRAYDAAAVKGYIKKGVLGLSRITDEKSEDGRKCSVWHCYLYDDETARLLGLGLQRIRKG